MSSFATNSTALIPAAASSTTAPAASETPAETPVWEGSFNELELTRIASFMDPHALGKFRRVSKQYKAVAERNAVWEGCLTKKGLQDFHARYVIHTTVAGQPATFKAPIPQDAARLFYRDNFAARAYYAGGLDEVRHIISLLDHHFIEGYKRSLCAKLVQMNVIKLSNFFAPNSHTQTDSYGFSGQPEAYLEALIPLIRQGLISEADTQVLYYSYIPLLSLPSDQTPTVAADSQRRLKYLQNYVALKKIGLTITQINCFTLCGYTAPYAFEYLDVLRQVLAEGYMTKDQVVDLYKQFSQNSIGSLGLNIFTPNLLAYFKKGILSAEMLGRITVEDTASISFIVACDGVYGNKMRALYEGLCDKIKAKGQDSWSVFANCLFPLFANIFFQQRKAGSEQLEDGAHFSQQIDAEFASRTQAPDAEGTGPIVRSYTDKIEDVAFWTEIEKGALSADALFVLFEELEAMMQERSQTLKGYTVQNLVYLTASYINELVSAKERESFADAVLRLTSLMRMALSDRHIALVSSHLQDQGVSQDQLNELETIDFREYHKHTSYDKTSNLPAFDQLPFSIKFSMFFYGPLSADLSLKDEHKIKQALKCQLLIYNFAHEFRLLSHIPTEIQRENYILLGMRSIGAALKLDCITSDELPEFLKFAQNFHDNKGLDRFVAALKAGLPADNREREPGSISGIPIFSFLLANFKDKLKLSDITGRLQYALKHSADTVDETVDTLFETDLVRNLIALATDQVTVEEWIKGQFEADSSDSNASAENGNMVDDDDGDEV